jgi:hypothetical protein
MASINDETAKEPWPTNVGFNPDNPLKRCHSPEGTTENGGTLEPPENVVAKRIATETSKSSSKKESLGKESTTPPQESSTPITANATISRIATKSRKINQFSTNKTSGGEEPKISTTIATASRIASKNQKSIQFSTNKILPLLPNEKPFILGTKPERFSKPEYRRIIVSDDFGTVETAAQQPVARETAKVRTKVVSASGRLVFSPKTPCTLGNSLGLVRKAVCGRSGMMFRVNGAVHSPCACIDHHPRLKELVVDFNERIWKVAPAVSEFPYILTQTVAGEGYVYSF